MKKNWMLVLLILCSNLLFAQDISAMSLYELPFVDVFAATKTNQSLTDYPAP